MTVCYDMTHANDVIRECGDKAPTLESRMGTGGNQVPLVLCYDMSQTCDAVRECGAKAPTLKARMGIGGQKVPLVLKTYRSTTYSTWEESPLSATVRAERCNVGNGDAALVEQGNQIGGVCIPMCIPLNMSPLTRINSDGSDGIGKPGEPSTCLGTTVGGWGVAYSVYENQRSELRLSDRTNSVVVGGGKPGQGYTAVLKEEPMGDCRVRRLTPKECERLQGFPDDWTKIPYRGKDAEHCPDSPRYKAIGNSWAVPVVRWIGERIDRHAKKQEA